MLEENSMIYFDGTVQDFSLFSEESGRIMIQQSCTSSAMSVFSFGVH